MTIPEILDLDGLEEVIYREYDDLETGFDSQALYEIASEIRSRKTTKSAREAIDKLLGIHMDRHGVADIAVGPRDRKEPPCYTAFVVEVLQEQLSEEVDKPDPESLGEKVLYCFDRDATVETGVPRGPVPLATLERLAEEHVVYATGNQRLRHEAAVRGVVDVHNGQVSRRRGISLVWQNECKHVDVTVAVDDVDVSNVSDVDVYYEPWEFYLLNTETKGSLNNGVKEKP